MTQYIEQLYKDRDESFRNAQKMQNLAHRLADVHRRRLAKVKNPSDEERMQITASDVKKAIAQRSVWGGC